MKFSAVIVAATAALASAGSLEFMHPHSVLIHTRTVTATTTITAACSNGPSSVRSASLGILSSSKPILPSTTLPPPPPTQSASGKAPVPPTTSPSPSATASTTSSASASPYTAAAAPTGLGVSSAILGLGAFVAAGLIL